MQEMIIHRSLLFDPKTYPCSHLCLYTLAGRKSTVSRKSKLGRKSREKRERRTSEAKPASRNDARPVPPGWGDDALSKFLQVAHENAFFVFTQHRPVFDLLRSVHEAFDLAVGIGSHSRPKYLAFFVARASRRSGVHCCASRSAPTRQVCSRLAYSWADHRAAFRCAAACVVRSRRAFLDRYQR